MYNVWLWVFFTHIRKDLIMIIVYVDDTFFGKNSRAVKKVKKTFMDDWALWDE